MWKDVLKADVRFESRGSSAPYGKYIVDEDVIEMNLSRIKGIMDTVGTGDYDLSEEEAIELISDRIAHEGIHAAQSLVDEINEPDRPLPDDFVERANVVAEQIRKKAFRLYFNELTARLPEGGHDIKAAANLMAMDLRAYFSTTGNTLYDSIHNNALKEISRKVLSR